MRSTISVSFLALARLIPQYHPVPPITFVSYAGQVSLFVSYFSARQLQLKFPTLDQARLDTRRFTSIARSAARLLCSIENRPHALHLLLLGLVLELLLDSGVAVGLGAMRGKALVL